MLYHKLQDLEATGDAIQVGLLAAGTFGTQIVSQMTHVNGMRVAVIAELDREKALRAYGHGGIASNQVITAETPNDIDDAIASGHPAKPRFDYNRGIR